MKGQLIDGYQFKDNAQKEFELKPVISIGEYFDAEAESNAPVNSLGFKGAMLARQLVRIGDCPGPFTLEMVRKLSPRDFQTLMKAQQELEADSGPKEADAN